MTNEQHNPADTSGTIDEILLPIKNDFVVSFSGDTERLIDEARAAIERLMKQERKQLLDEAIRIAAQERAVFVKNILGLEHDLKVRKQVRG